jgi:hypothetical protein
MTEQAEEYLIAEKYLKEMLEADNKGDFDLYTRCFEEDCLNGFTEEIFRNDIAHMHEENGMHSGYDYLGNLRNQTIDDKDVYRTVWKGIYEKRDAIIEMGIYKKKGVWYVIRSAVF